MNRFSVALLLALFPATAFSQTPSELNTWVRERIEHARASIVTVKAANDAGETVSQGQGFFVRKDLIATDGEVVDRKSRLHVSVATKSGAPRVVSSGSYLLPYVLLEPQPDVSPLTVAENEEVSLNSNVYMLSDSGEIITGTVTGKTKINNTPALLLSLSINSTNRGAPIFNRYGDVIGIAAKSPDGQSAGLAWPAELLATLKHLGEPGVGVGAGTGPRFENPEPASNVPSASIVDSRPVRLRSPEPRYTEEARANSIQGTVSLRVQVKVDGSVGAIRVVRGLPYGLSEQAIEVARNTKFKPAMKDGQPVAFWIGLEISFILR